MFNVELITGIEHHDQVYRISYEEGNYRKAIDVTIRDYRRELEDGSRNHTRHQIMDGLERIWHDVKRDLADMLDQKWAISKIISAPYRLRKSRSPDE